MRLLFALLSALIVTPLTHAGMDFTKMSGESDKAIMGVVAALDLIKADYENNGVEMTGAISMYRLAVLKLNNGQKNDLQLYGIPAAVERIENMLRKPNKVLYPDERDELKKKIRLSIKELDKKVEQMQRVGGVVFASSIPIK